MEEMGVCNTGD